MISEWLRVMLDEISRKKIEAELDRVEQQTRDEQQKQGSEQARPDRHERAEQQKRGL